MNIWNTASLHEAIPTVERRKDYDILKPALVLYHFIDIFSQVSDECPCNVVDIATGYGLDGPGIESRWGARFSAPVQTGPGAHPASCTMGTGSFAEVKRSGRDADHPPPI